MPEEDQQVFAEIWNIYNEYRWKQMRPDDFIEMTKKVGAMAELHKWQENPLACRLAEAILFTFDDLYSGGKVPAIPDYIGRSDL